jgi:hypothetical protein
MNTRTPPLTKARARQLLAQSREDIAMLLGRQYETQTEIHRLLLINNELHAGILGEDAPEMRVRAEIDVAS